jgi:hypothetical protein
VDGHERVADVVRLVEEGLELGLFQAAPERLHARLEILVDRLALAGELEEDVDVLLGLEQDVNCLNLALEALPVLLEALVPLLVLPDVRGGQLFGQSGELGLLLVIVKENLAALRAWRTARGPGLRGR